VTARNGGEERRGPSDTAVPGNDYIQQGPAAPAISSNLSPGWVRVDLEPHAIHITYS
jgi:hypothetical protein